MNSEAFPKSSAPLVRGAIAFVRSRVRGRRLAEMLLALGLMLLVAAIVAIPPVLLGQIVTKATPDGVVKGYDFFSNIKRIASFSDIWPYILLLGCLILLREALILIRKYLVEKVATSIEAEEYFLVSKHILSLDLGELAQQRAGAVNLRIHRSIEGLVQFLKISFMEFLPIIATAAVALFVALFQSAMVAALMVIVALLGLLVTTVQIKSQQGVRKYLFEAKAELSANISEVLNGIDYVRAAGMTGREAERTRVISENFRATEFRHHKWMMSFDSAKQLVEGFGYVAVIGVSAWLASLNQIAPGEVLTFAMFYANFTNPLQSLHRILDEGWEACLKIQELTDTYDKTPDPGLSGNRKPQPGPLSVECKNLKLSYRSHEGSLFTALNGIDFDLANDEVVGIAGPSGSGKSSFIRLLLGLTSNYAGKAELFGVDVREIDKDQLSRLIAYVPQTPFLVKGSIRQNVTYSSSGDSAPSEEQIRFALEKARFAEKTALSPAGLEADILEQGRNLSGGERQRLALTRLFLSDARLILLDEPTAALDTANQEAVQEAIFEFVRGRSAIIVAHRLNTLQKTDRIIVLDKGKIVESGTYTVLASREGGLFRNLIEKERLEGELRA